MLAGGVLIIVILNPEHMKFEIKNFDTKEDIANGSSTSIALLKLAAKKAAKGAGVVFFDEIRKTKEKTQEVPNV